MELSDKDLIRKYFSGKCDRSESKRACALMADPGSERLMDEILSEYGNPVVAEDALPYDQDMEARLKVIHRRIGEEKGPRWFYRIPSIRYAAACLAILLSAAVFSLLYLKHIPTAGEPVAWIEEHTDNGIRKKVVLADSSVIYLGGGSGIRFPKGFNGNIREVFLEGDAFFEVAPDPGKPFIVHTGDFQTRVLGTSFRVTSFRPEEATIAVATGKVAIEQISENGRSVLGILNPGQQLKYENEKALISNVPVENLLGWKDGSLIYLNKPLREIAEELERWYGVDFEFRIPEKAAILMDVNILASTPIEKVLRVLSVSGGFKYEMTPQKIVIH